MKNSFQDKNMVTELSLNPASKRLTQSFSALLALKTNRENIKNFNKALSA